MIRQPDSPKLKKIAAEIREHSQDLHLTIPQLDAWPSKQLELCGNAGFYRWFVSEKDGGFSWSSSDIAKGYLELSSACLTTTFVLTQRIAALKRIAGCKNEALRQRMLPDFLEGKMTATVGISHLTTSRQHLEKPALKAKHATNDDREGYLIDGLSPWVTGGAGADWILMGAQLLDENGQATEKQVLFVVPTNETGVTVLPGQFLVALSATQTGKVDCNNVFIPSENVLAGPIENVLAGNGGGAGGLQTSILALGLAKSAIEFIEVESANREELGETHQPLQLQFDHICEQLFTAADAGNSDTASSIRSQSNSLALRATQAALVVAKGSGFVQGHPVGRWCSEALFFLVWSCPQNVAQANLSEFAECRLY